MSYKEKLQNLVHMEINKGKLSPKARELIPHLVARYRSKGIFTLSELVDTCRISGHVVRKTLNILTRKDLVYAFSPPKLKEMYYSFLKENIEQLQGFDALLRSLYET